MIRWRLLLAAAASATALMCFTEDELTHARRIHGQTIGIDTHIDTMNRVLNEGVDIGRRLPDGHVDIPRLKQGGMRAPFFSLWVPVYYKGAEAVRRTLQLRDAIQRVFESYPQDIELARTAADVERIAGAGKIAAILALEGGHQIADDLAALRMYHLLGIRAMTLTHFRDNNWADSSTDAPRHNGLTEFGKQVVREMNRIGMIVDISHVSDKTFFDTLQVAAKPVIASHSSCRALTDIPRNMSDEQLRALARNGGVIGINFGSGFVSQKSAESLKRSIASMTSREPNLTGKELDDFARQDWIKEFRRSGEPQASLQDAVAHIDHAVKVAGIDHVGIGSDYDGVTSVPAGLDDISKMPALTAALLKKGYSEPDVKKILGGNFLRVLREVTGK